MNIEDIIRRIIREELEKFHSAQPKVEQKEEPKVEPPETIDDTPVVAYEPDSEPVVIENSAQLLQHIKEMCGGNRDMQTWVGDIVKNKFGYKRVSLIPDAEAQKVWEAIEDAQ